MLAVESNKLTLMKYLEQKCLFLSYFCSPIFKDRTLQKKKKRFSECIIVHKLCKSCIHQKYIVKIQDANGEVFIGDGPISIKSINLTFLLTDVDLCLRHFLNLYFQTSSTHCVCFHLYSAKCYMKPNLLSGNGLISQNASLFSNSSEIFSSHYLLPDSSLKFLNSEHLQYLPLLYHFVLSANF